MLETYDNFSYRVAMIATVLAFVVVTLGAYTRLKDAGLGCPDWPGCYGRLVVSSSIPALEGSAAHAAKAPEKAWTEMVHRYVAGTLGILIITLAVRALIRRRKESQPWLLPQIMVAVVLFQAALGMWTVTLQLLPPIVMLHLLGGMTLLSLLMLLVLKLKRSQPLSEKDSQRYKPWIIVGLIILILQILLGGWTSANYAALICNDFPFCHEVSMPTWDFQHAFNVWLQIGPNYQGGLLSNAARITIHMMHRLGALVTFLYLSGMSLWMMMTCESRRLFWWGRIVLLLVCAQATLGILNVVLQLPIVVAVAHNGFAALLLLCLVSITAILISPNMVLPHEKTE